MSELRDYIPRTLSWCDDNLKMQTVADSDIVHRFSEPVVILGDPGIGKTWLMEMLGAQDDHEFIRATSLLRQPDGSDFGGKTLVIDGLDEVSAINDGDPLHNVLTKLIACRKPAFLISSRAAEWRYVTGKIDISDEYGVTPKVLNLELLDEDDAARALTRRADPTKAREAIAALKMAELTEFFRNPLYLDFVAAIINDDGAMPTTRAELYDRAIRQLRFESNPRHKDKGVDALSTDEALDAAGTIMAAMLITGQHSISVSVSDQHYLSIAELSELAPGDNLKKVLTSNLFRSQSGDKGLFAPLHRTVAEFLGARWLARHVGRHPNSKYMAGRVVGLIAGEGGVPSSLRGLHSWFPKFSPMQLGPGAIDRDPYGVIRYGDGDGLTAEQARRLISALRQLSLFNPWFREGYWASEAIGALAQPALIHEIRKLIADDSETFMLRSLILEAVANSSVASQLRLELEAILFDSGRTYRERRLAGEAIARSVNDFDWSAALAQLLKSRHIDTGRLTTELLDDIGFETIPVDLVATVIMTNGRLFQTKSKEARTFGTFYRLQTEYPIERVSYLLDELSARILPKLNPKKWWSDGYDDRWSEFATLIRRLIVRLLESDADSVSPNQLWNWLRTIEREYLHGGDERKALANILRDDNRLRRGVQHAALLAPDLAEGFFSAAARLQRLSGGFGFTDEDALEILTEVVRRKDPNDREKWMGLVSRFRTEGVIPVHIRKVARPFAKGDEELLKFLVSKPKRLKLEAWEIRHRRNMRKRAEREQESRTKARASYRENLEAVRRGDLGWILSPAQAYLGMFRDFNNENPPPERVAEWLGDDIRDVVLEGFEAVLHRSDLPTADEIAQFYAESRVWNYTYPMLAAAGQRFSKGQNFEDLPELMISALAISCENELLSGREQFDGLEVALKDCLRRDPSQYEAHLKRKFEPLLAKNATHISGLYSLARDVQERPLSARLSADWLRRFPNLSYDVERELAGCLLYSPVEHRAELLPILAEITGRRLAKMSTTGDRYRFWRGIQFTLDFDEAVRNFPSVTARNREWLWYVTRPIYQKLREREHYPTAHLKHLHWIVTTFRKVWPHTSRPSGTTSGDQNAWDATELIEWTIYQIAKDPSDAAARYLRGLRDDIDDGYAVTLQSSIASQQRARLEANYQTPSLDVLKAILSEDGAPQNAADVQSIVLSELDLLRGRLRGHPLNPVNNFYNDAGIPRIENDCRDQMLIALGPTLPYGIQMPPEVAMPQGNRSDGAFTYDQIAIPLECKGQWHKDVWTSAASQLDRYYAIEHKAARKGIYVVFWFGSNVPPNRGLKAPPDNAPSPATPHDMQLALEALIPIERRADIAVVVLDLTR